MPHPVVVQKVGLVPSVREVHVSGHMGPAYVVPLPGYGYAAQHAPTNAHFVPASHQALIGHAPVVSAPAQHHQPMIHHTPIANHHGHASQNPSPVGSHYAKSVEYEMLEDVVSPVKKSTKTHKTSHQVSSKPVKHNIFVDSAYASASNHGDNDDYVQEEMHDVPAHYHNSMKEQFPSHQSPVIAHVSASNNGQVMHGHNVPASSSLHSFSSPQQHNEIVQRGSVRYLGGEERLKSRSNGYVL